MGVTTSSTSAPVVISDKRFEVIFDKPFPEDLIVEVLSFVSGEDLVKNCSLVCHQWNDLISGHGIWKRKCVREGRCIPPIYLETTPKHFYRHIYFQNPYDRNLLENPCGEDGLNGWEIQSEGGDGWTTENPPQGAEPVPQEVGSTFCFATSYQHCEKFQRVNLVRLGISAEVMDKLRPQIVISEWHASRFDCGTIYELRLKLLDARLDEVDTVTLGPYREEQWVGRAWEKVDHTFKDYPAGVRYIVYEHCGCDTQFWAGHYGSKMTGGSIRLQFS